MRGFLIMLALLLTATLAEAAGFRFVEVPVDGEGPALKGAIWSPCSEAAGEIDLGNLNNNCYPSRVSWAIGGHGLFRLAAL